MKIVLKKFMQFVKNSFHIQRTVLLPSISAVFLTCRKVLWTTQTLLHLLIFSRRTKRKTLLHICVKAFLLTTQITSLHLEPWPTVILQKVMKRFGIFIRLSLKLILKKLTLQKFLQNISKQKVIQKMPSAITKKQFSVILTTTITMR